MGAPELVQRFPINRFKHFLSYLHFNDKTVLPRQNPAHDKLHKIQTVLDVIASKCLQLYQPHQANCINKAMVGFKGCSTIKHMPMKPTKRRFKVWCRCDAQNGYTCSFQTCVHGLGTRVVMDLFQPILGKGYHLYFNIFSSSRGYCGTGVRSGYAESRGSCLCLPCVETTRNVSSGSNAGNGSLLYTVPAGV